MPSSYGGTVRLATIGACLVGLSLGLLAILASYAASWGEAVYWAQGVLFLSGLALTWLASVSALIARTRSPGHLLGPTIAALAGCVVGLVFL